MKKFIIIMTVICVASASIVGTAMLKNDELPKIENTNSTIEDKLSEAFERLPESVAKKQYVIKEYNEKIGIFRKGAGKPVRVLETFVFTLPCADRIMLSAGFTVSEENLYKIVEDYTG